MRRVELVGAMFIMAAGVPLHFLYSNSHWLWIAWLAPINESVWEHFKLAFWPGLFFALVARDSIRPNYWLARFSSLAATPLLIMFFFYGGRALAPNLGLVADIGNFFVSVALAQWLGTSILKSDRHWGFEVAAILDIALMAILFVAFTYWPPSFGLFVPPN